MVGVAAALLFLTRPHMRLEEHDLLGTHWRAFSCPGRFKIRVEGTPSVVGGAGPSPTDGGQAVGCVIDGGILSDHRPQRSERSARHQAQPTANLGRCPQRYPLSASWRRSLGSRLSLPPRDRAVAGAASRSSSERSRLVSAVQCLVTRSSD